MRTIEIDLGIHKLIERERHDFSETEAAILRRLLKLDDIEELKNTPTEIVKIGLPWRGRNRKTGRLVELPHGEKIFGIYNEFRIEAEIINGKLKVENEYYDSLSRAAIENVRTKSGSKTPLNGWNVWHRKVGGTLVKMIEL